MPRMSEEDVELFLARPYMAVIATLKRSGAPYTVPVIFLWRDGAFYFTGTYNRQWCKHLLRDPRASVTIEATTPDYGHVGADGSVELIDEQNPAMWPAVREMVEKYAPLMRITDPQVVDDHYGRIRAEPRLVFKLLPSKLRAIDMSIYQGKRADREHQAANGVDPTGIRLPRPLDDISTLS